MTTTIFNEWIGKTIFEVSIQQETEYNDEAWFYFKNGDIWKMYHAQDCCESVFIEEIIGDTNDLLSSPLVEAEEVSQRHCGGYEDSTTWTFYKFRTEKGSVNIRWKGMSNGYYSESVDMCHYLWYDLVKPEIIDKMLNNVDLLTMSSAENWDFLVGNYPEILDDDNIKFHYEAVKSAELLINVL